MCVYFIQADKGGPIKIGAAVDPHKRLYQLQSGNPYQLVIRCLVKGAYEEERFFHKFFSEDRLRGEWFKPNNKLEELFRLFPFEGAVKNSPSFQGVSYFMQNIT